jgi:hypothetical protein
MHSIKIDKNYGAGSPMFIQLDLVGKISLVARER